MKHVLSKIASIVTVSGCMLFGYADAVFAGSLLPATMQNLISSTTGMSAQSPLVTAANIIAAILGFLSVIAIGLIVYAGFTWMFAAGNEEKIKKARGILQAAVLGLLIILSSYGIAIYVFSVIESATGQGAVPV